MEESRNERIKRILKESNVGHDLVGKSLGRNRNSITERLNEKKQIDSYSFLEAVSKLTGRSMYELYHGIKEPTVVSEPKESYEKRTEELVDAQKALIKCMAEKEQITKEFEELKKFSAITGEQKLEPVKKNA